MIVMQSLIINDCSNKVHHLSFMLNAIESMALLYKVCQIWLGGQLHRKHSSKGTTDTHTGSRKYSRLGSHRKLEGHT